MTGTSTGTIHLYTTLTSLPADGREGLVCALMLVAAGVQCSQLGPPVHCVLIEWGPTS